MHVPFCARQCRYCDFAIHIERQPDLDHWSQAVSLEWRRHLSDPGLEVKAPLDSLYVGGGTPSALGADLGVAVVELMGKRHIPEEAGEWTMEANPESFDRAAASAWREAGVSRVSIGVQSFHEPSLRWMARMHDAEDAARALNAARDAGFDRMSVDLIFGLPTHLGRSWTLDLERVLDLGPPHISLYGLTVEEGTPLWKAMRNGREQPVSPDRYAEEYLEACERLARAGYDQYEVSNFALPGQRARHNPTYWTHAPYLGVGNGAHSFLPPERRWNVRSWPEYRGLVHQGSSPIGGQEVLDCGQRVLEEVWLALRTAEGYLLPRGFRTEGSRVTGRVGSWTRAGLARMDGDRVRLTPRGWLTIDEMAADLARDLEESERPPDSS